MTTYVDSSALLKRYLNEPDRDIAQDYLAADPVLASSWISAVEVRRNLARHLSGSDLIERQSRATADFNDMAMITCDEVVANSAAQIGEALGVRSLDAIHLATAQRLQIADLTFLTFDIRQAQAARSLGFTVRGA